jgi:hypothetical protein
MIVEVIGGYLASRCGRAYAAAELQPQQCRVCLGIGCVQTVLCSIDHSYLQL